MSISSPNNSDYEVLLSGDSTEARRSQTFVEEVPPSEEIDGIVAEMGLSLDEVLGGATVLDEPGVPLAEALG